MNEMNVDPPQDPLFLEPWTSAAKILVYAVVFVAAVLGNALVLGAVTANPSMHSSVNLLILNMSIADLILMLVVTLPHLQNELFVGAHPNACLQLTHSQPSRASTLYHFYFTGAG